MVNRNRNHWLFSVPLVEALKRVRISVPVIVVELVLSHALVAGICLNLGRCTVEKMPQSISLERISSETQRLYERWKNEHRNTLEATRRH